MANRIDDCVERIRAESVVLLRERQFARCGEIRGREAKRRHHALHAHPLARPGAAQIDALAAKLCRGADGELAPGHDRERLGLTREQYAQRLVRPARGEGSTGADRVGQNVRLHDGDIEAPIVQRFDVGNGAAGRIGCASQAALREIEIEQATNRIPQREVDAAWPAGADRHVGPVLDERARLQR
jgi:hypothetical protein